MGEILLRIIIAAASAALLTTEGAKKMGKDDDNSTFFTIFAVEFETAYGNASHISTTGRRTGNDIHRSQSRRHRTGHIRHGGGVHPGVRLRTGARSHPYRRDAHHCQCHYGVGSTAGGRRTGLYGERGGTIAEEASQPYHLPGTIRHMAVQPLGRYGSYMLCTAAYHIGDSTQGEGASRTSAECGDGSGIAGVYGFASVSRHGSYPL